MLDGEGKGKRKRVEKVGTYLFFKRAKKSNKINIEQDEQIEHTSQIGQIR